MSDEMLRAALAYAKRGWAVMPCQPKGKPPVLSMGKDHKDASKDEKSIRQWWGKGHDFNVGIVTGLASGLYVVDVDAVEHEILARLEPTLTARTRKGGWHFYYLDDTGLRSTTGKLAPNVDTRGAGGYVVAPPSFVAGRDGVSGRYSWVDESVAPVPLPQWIRDALSRPDVPKASASMHAKGSHGLLGAYGKQALEGEIGKLAMAREGERNAALNQTAFKVGQLVAGGDVEEQTAREALESVALRIGLDPEETMRTIESGLTSGKDHPRTRAEKERPATGVVGPPAAPSPEVEDKKAPRFPPIQDLPLGILSEAPPARDFLAWQENERGDPRGVLARGQLTILAGEGGSGKGRWVTSLAVALGASVPPKEPRDLDIKGLPGMPWGGMSTCGLQCAPLDANERILMLLGEDDLIDVWSRVQASAKALEVSPASPAERHLLDRVRWASGIGIGGFTVATEEEARGRQNAEPTAAWTAFVEELKAKAAKEPWALIVIDPLARFGGVEENDNVLQTQMLAMVEDLTTVNGDNRRPPAVLVVDHVAKLTKGIEVSQHSIRGATAKVNSARFAMVMVPGGDEVTVDRDGRTAVEDGFDSRSGLAKVGEAEVFWKVVKANGVRKAESICLAFTRDGALIVEDEETKRERRARQWKAAFARGDVKWIEGGSKRGRQTGGGSPPPASRENENGLTPDEKKDI